MSKLWQKNNEVASAVEKFTIGNDQAMDQYLASYDVLGSIAHITMLSEVGLLTADELVQLKKALVEIYQSIQDEKFTLSPGVEDIHSQVEILLTSKLGDVGKKIHSARSRNDQVLVDLKLYLRHEIMELVGSVQSLFTLLQAQSEKYKMMKNLSLICTGLLLLLSACKKNTNEPDTPAADKDRDGTVVEVFASPLFNDAANFIPSFSGNYALIRTNSENKQFQYTNDAGATWQELKSVKEILSVNDKGYYLFEPPTGSRSAACCGSG